MDTALEAIVEFALATTTGEDLRLYDTARSTCKSSITPLRTNNQLPARTECLCCLVGLIWCLCWDALRGGNVVL